MAVCLINTIHRYAYFLSKIWQYNWPAMVHNVIQYPECKLHTVPCHQIHSCLCYFGTIELHGVRQQEQSEVSRVLLWIQWRSAWEKQSAGWTMIMLFCEGSKQSQYMLLSEMQLPRSHPVKQNTSKAHLLEHTNQISFFASTSSWLHEASEVRILHQMIASISTSQNMLHEIRIN